MRHLSQMKRSVLLGIMLLSLACTKQQAARPAAVELSRDHECSVCGMIIVDYPGAKGQIHYRKGGHSVFCSTLDLFLFYLQPDRPADIAAIYVNDMGKADFSRPEGHWIDAEKAFFVMGGDVMVPMGEALVSFAEKRAAEDYVKKHGGRIIAFADVTMDMLRPAAQHSEKPPR